MRALLAAALVLSACSNPGPGFDYPNDDVRSLFHVQTFGTHNSYHVETAGNDVPEWMYTHPPLDEQLRQGKRQFELDLNVNIFDGDFEVYHFYRADEGTTCRKFVDCLRALKRWSDDNRGHHPFAVMLELKDNYDPAFEDQFFAMFEAELASVWPEDRLITPDLIQGNHATLRDAVATDGWPSLGEVRGRALFFLLADEPHVAHYTRDHTSLAGRLAFVETTPDSPYAAVTKVDDPVAGVSSIAAALDANLLVRTRIDALGPNGPIIDQARFAAAAQSGAHFLSTDDPDAMMPGGSPSWCNPVTAPPDCEAVDLENPAFVD